MPNHNSKQRRVAVCGTLASDMVIAADAAEKTSSDEEARIAAACTIAQEINDHAMQLLIHITTVEKGILSDGRNEDRADGCESYEKQRTLEIVGAARRLLNIVNR